MNRTFTSFSTHARRVFPALALTLTLGLAVTGCEQARSDDSPINEVTAEQTQGVSPNQPEIRDAASLSNAFSTVAETAEPAVVTITTERQLTPTSRTGMSPFVPGGPTPPGMEEGPRAGGLGSGFIYDASGLIMTNAHVVRDADTVTVELADGRRFSNARVLGQDARSDIAVLKIDADNLPTVKLADSSKVRVGEWAIAVGNPFGLAKTLTVGVISAVSREVPLSEAGPGNYLQTDASINPGNSGGPLLNIQGQVVGVNNAILSRTGGNVGIGFAIPINTAREIADQLAKEGRVRRARLGVATTDISDGQARAFGLPADTRGALVQEVSPDSPAARAGLQPGDIITGVNGQKVEDGGDLQQTVSRAPIGQDATFSILRGGETVTVTARLEELRDESAAPRPSPTPAPPATGDRMEIGVALAPLTSALADRYGLDEAASGVLVGGVEQGSPAARAGLRPGDVIERVGQTGVATPQEASTEIRRILGDRSGGDSTGVALYVNRGGQRQYVIVGGR